MCTGSAFPTRVLSGQLQPINVGREIAGYHWTAAGIHMHEAQGPDSLAELSITFRGTNFRELATPHPHLPQLLAAVGLQAPRKPNRLGCPQAICVLKEFDGLLPLKILVTFRNIQLQ